MKGCELCRFPARMYCEADEASLCWDCDEKVHCANFLVAKHSRNLLCHICQSPTPWKASGPKLGPSTTVSVCDTCVHSFYSTTSAKHENIRVAEQSRPLLNEDDEDTTSTEYGDDEEEEEDSEAEYGEDDEDDEEMEEDGENQVVPWSSSTPPPPLSSSTTEEHLSSCCTSFSAASDEIGSSLRLSDNVSYHGASEKDEANSLSCCSSRPLKIRRTNEMIQANEVEDAVRGGGGGGGGGEAEYSRTATIIVSELKKYQQQSIIAGKEDASATIIGICNLCKNT